MKKKQFKLGDQALLFDSKFNNFQGKLTTQWLGPYEVKNFLDNRSIKLKTIDDEQVSFVVNGHILIFYHKPMTREDFVHNVLRKSKMEVGNVGILLLLHPLCYHFVISSWL